MRLILIPKGMDITATLGMAALSVIIGALIGSIMIPVYVIRKMEYMPVDCLQVPKMLFQVEEFKNLSNTAKILYSLFLDPQPKQEKVTVKELAKQNAGMVNIEITDKNIKSFERYSRKYGINYA